ncbi:hypothetical protein [Pedobacter westerhofensis]|nr:hypothetical protein [Pedobacter westerhofensis]
MTVALIKPLIAKFKHITGAIRFLAVTGQFEGLGNDVDITIFTPGTSH